MKLETIPHNNSPEPTPINRERAAFGAAVAIHAASRQWLIISLVLTLGFSAYAGEPQTGTNSPVRLTPATFTDYEFTLISDKDYLYYLFLENGSVDETFGNKGKKSPMVALGEGWRIDHGNTLVFTGVPDMPHPDGTAAFPNPVRHTLQFKSFGEKIVVTMDGDKYRRSKLKRPD